MVTWDLTYLPQIAFEIIVSTIGIICWIIMLKRYMKKKNEGLKLLITFMGIYVLAMVLTTYSQFNKRLLDEPLISFIDVGYYDQGYKLLTFFANYAFYLFFFWLNSTEDETQQKSQFYRIFTIIAVILTVTNIVLASIPAIFEKYEPYMLIMDLVLLIHSMILYLPVSNRVYKLYRKVDPGVQIKYTFLCVFMMSMLFTAIWFANIIDTVWNLLTSILYGPFWIVIWVCILLAILSGYLGYIKPQLVQKVLEN